MESMWSEISPRFVHKRAPECVEEKVTGAVWVTFRAGCSDVEIPIHAHRLRPSDEAQG